MISSKGFFGFLRRLGRRSAARSVALLAVAAAVAACTSTTSPALNSGDQNTVAQVQTYLDSLRSFRARFIQIASDGEATGTLWLDRPGRLRVEYVEPVPKLLLANHGRLLLADRNTGATTTMPVSRTPLDILLADRIALSGAVTIISVQHFATTLQVGLAKTGAPSEGRLTLQFAATPLALIGVVVQDSSGHTNTLQLFGLTRDPPIDPAMFRYLPTPVPAG